MTRRARLLAPFLLACLAILAASPGRVAHAADATIIRVSGSDRYGTSVEVSQTFAPGVSAAYVAVGTNFPDALSGAAAAGANRDPLLLVQPDSIPPSVAAELTRLAPARIVILGSTGAISVGVEALLHQYTPGPVDRIAGVDRYETSAAISAATFAPGVPAAFVATGTNFPDALAGAAAAGHDGAPILLVNGTSIPTTIAAELTRLAPAKIVVLGGPTIVSPAVAAALQSFTAGPVERIGGTDRYSTAAAISQATYPQADTVYLATGQDFPDALTGAALGGPLLMAQPGNLPAAVHDEIVRLGATRIVVLGGRSAISDSVAAAAAGNTFVVPTGHFAGDLYDPAAVRWQQPNVYACTSAAALMMLNMTALRGPSKGDGFAWTPSVALDLENAMLDFERQNMTMVVDGTNGTDPHGWRNALNYYGWGSLSADVYRDEAFGSFGEAVKAAITSEAQFGKPVGLLMMGGRHAELINGWDVTGEDPSTGSTNFAVNGVFLTDPWQPNGHEDTYVPLAWLQAGAPAVRFTPYLETDSPYQDPVDGKIGNAEWYGQYVIIAPVR